VIQAGALSEGREIFLLNMGKHVGILELAYDMVRLSGLEPNVDTPIVFSGPRPGEMLFEELRTDDVGPGIVLEVHHKTPTTRYARVVSLGQGAGYANE